MKKVSFAILATVMLMFASACSAESWQEEDKRNAVEKGTPPPTHGVEKGTPPPPNG